MQQRKHWWNGKMGRHVRRDIKIHFNDRPWVVEAREGGMDGTTRRWELPDEDTALGLARDLMGDDPSWRDLSDIARTSPIHERQ